MACTLSGKRVEEGVWTLIPPPHKRMFSKNCHHGYVNLNSFEHVFA